jgi:hypothetical protein
LLLKHLFGITRTEVGMFQSLFRAEDYLSIIHVLKSNL